jgi:3-hydroxyisobutyrate dehydrogenase-like beta-hydroxyacid dehydrogenase
MSKDSISMQSNSIGFIGLGVMGEPICRNLALKAGRPVLGFDTNQAPLERLAQAGVRTATDVATVARSCDVLFLSLPSGEIVKQICHQPGGLLEHARSGQIFIDLSTSRVDTTRTLAAEFAECGATWVDAPVARTRAAAEAGSLSVMVGAQAEVFERVKPLIATFATDIALCGPVGCGQVVKILNNMVLFETVVALSEAKAIGERSGVPVDVLFATLANGSADSFALRSHGMKSIQPGTFPERAFSVRYARKDLAYALQLAQDTGVDARAAHTVDQWFAAAIEQNLGDQYHPVISQVIAQRQPSNAASA